MSIKGEIQQQHSHSQQFTKRDPLDVNIKPNSVADELQLTGNGTTWNHNYMRTSLSSSLISFCIAGTSKHYYLKTKIKSHNNS